MTSDFKCHGKKIQLKDKTPKKQTLWLFNEIHLSFRKCYKLSVCDVCCKIHFWILSKVHFVLQSIPDVPENQFPN